MFKFIKQIHLARAAMLLLVALLTTGSAWADDVDLSEENGTKCVEMPGSCC